MCEPLRFMKNQYRVALILIHSHAHTYSYTSTHREVSAFTLQPMKMQQQCFFVYIVTSGVGVWKGILHKFIYIHTYLRTPLNKPLYNNNDAYT